MRKKDNDMGHRESWIWASGHSAKPQVSVCRVEVMVVVAKSSLPRALAIERNSSSRETRRPRLLLSDRTTSTQFPFWTDLEKTPLQGLWAAHSAVCLGTAKVMESVGR